MNEVLVFCIRYFLDVVFPKNAAWIVGLNGFGLPQNDPDALAQVDRTPTQLPVLLSMPASEMPVPRGAILFKRLIQIT